MSDLRQPDHWKHPPVGRCWCGQPPRHGCWCHEHAPRCRSGAHFYGNCHCKGPGEEFWREYFKPLEYLQMSVQWAIEHLQEQNGKLTRDATGAELLRNEVARITDQRLEDVIVDVTMDGSYVYAFGERAVLR